MSGDGRELSLKCDPGPVKESREQYTWVTGSLHLNKVIQQWFCTIKYMPLCYEQA
jgi:predicted DNA-binding protein (MmcQ/YjbR family)